MCEDRDPSQDQSTSQDPNPQSHGTRFWCQWRRIGLSPSSKSLVLETRSGLSQKPRRVVTKAGAVVSEAIFPAISVIWERQLVKEFFVNLHQFGIPNLSLVVKLPRNFEMIHQRTMSSSPENPTVLIPQSPVVENSSDIYPGMFMNSLYPNHREAGLGKQRNCKHCENWLQQFDDSTGSSRTLPEPESWMKTHRMTSFSSQRTTWIDWQRPRFGKSLRFDPQNRFEGSSLLQKSLRKFIASPKIASKVHLLRSKNRFKNSLHRSSKTVSKIHHSRSMKGPSPMGLSPKPRSWTKKFFVPLCGSLFLISRRNVEHRGFYFQKLRHVVHFVKGTVWCSFTNETPSTNFLVNDAWCFSFDRIRSLWYGVSLSFHDFRNVQTVWFVFLVFFGSISCKVWIIHQESLWSISDSSRFQCTLCQTEHLALRPFFQLRTVHNVLQSFSKRVGIILNGLRLFLDIGLFS